MELIPDPSDSRQLKALAHPVRIGLLSALRRDGPGTSSTLCAALQVSSGLASYHLRVLADAGVIEEIEDRGTARERWWRAGHEQTIIEPRLVGEEDSDLLDAVEGMWDRRRSAVERRWSERQNETTTEWRGARDRSDWLLRLTPEEMRDAVHAVVEALDPFRLLSLARRDGTQPVPDDAGLIAAFLSVVPDADDALLYGKEHLP